MRQAILMTFAISVQLTACHAGIGPDPTGGTGASASASTSSGASSSSTSASSSASGNPNTQALSSGSRLKARKLTYDDGATEQIGWHDTTLGIDCIVGVATDGKLRCLPISSTLASILPFYVDAGCTMKVATFSGGCGTPTYAGQAAGPACVGGTPTYAPGNLFALGPAVAVSQIYSGTPGACVSAGSMPATVGYSLGAPVDPTTFVASTESLEP